VLKRIREDYDYIKKLENNLLECEEIQKQKNHNENIKRQQELQWKRQNELINENDKRKMQEAKNWVEKNLKHLGPPKSHPNGKDILYSHPKTGKYVTVK